MILSLNINKEADFRMEKEKNHRSTRQKAAILHYLQTSQGAHVTAEELAEELRKQELSVGRATVYRYLKQLEEEGAIQKYAMPDLSGSCYVYVGETSSCHRHYHLRCQKCGIILHVDSELPSRFSERMREEHQFIIDECKTVFYGVCGNCAKGE